MAALLAAVLVPQIAFPLFLSFAPDAFQRWVGVLFYVYATLFLMWIIWLIWLIWVMPYLASGDAQLYWLQPPKNVLSNWLVFIWMPTGFGLGFAVISPPFGWLLAALENRPVSEFVSLDLIAGGLALGAIGTIVALPLHHCIRARLHDQIKQRQICLDCGYDLRGNPDATACPECGWAIAWKKAA